MAEPAWLDLMALPGVSAAVERARASIAQVHRHLANRRGWAVTAAAASVRAARASAMLDGGVGLLDAESTIVRDPLLAGSFRVAAEIGALASTWQRSPLQALARLHTLAAADLVETDSDGTGRLGVQLSRSEAEALGRPRSADGVPGRLAQLAQVVLAAPWPGPIQVAVVHGELLGMRPFDTANGLVARGAARLTMIGSGLDPKGLTMPEVGHLRAGEAYRSAALSYAGGSDEGVARWLIHVCDALDKGAREAEVLADVSGVSH